MGRPKWRSNWSSKWRSKWKKSTWMHQFYSLITQERKAPLFKQVVKLVHPFWLPFRPPFWAPIWPTQILPKSVCTCHLLLDHTNFWHQKNKTKKWRQPNDVNKTNWRWNKPNKLKSNKNDVKHFVFDVKHIFDVKIFWRQRKLFDVKNIFDVKTVFDVNENVLTSNKFLTSTNVYRFASKKTVAAKSVLRNIVFSPNSACTWGVLTWFQGLV